MDFSKNMFFPRKKMLTILRRSIGTIYEPTCIT